LENLSLGAQGAAFELDGNPVRLDSSGYAAPVASLQEFYHHALADFYQRSAEITRRQAARPPLLGRLFAWIGGLFGRATSAAPAVSHPPTPPVIALSPPRTPAEPAQRAAEALSSFKSPEPERGAKPALDKSSAAPPLLQVVFADRDGVHVIWQLTPAKPETAGVSRDPAGAKAATPRLELTYRLDSTLAQRLQDCYGQLTQLGYKVAGLEAVQAAPEKPAAVKKAPRTSPAAPSPAAPSAVAEKPTAEIPKTNESKIPPRKPRPEGVPVQAEPEKPGSEPPNRDPSFLPGI
jgi:hypothetical protein